MERHPRPQRQVQKLLGSMEIPHCEERQTKAPLGIPPMGYLKTSQMILLRSRVSDVLTELYGGPSGGHLGVNKILDKNLQKYFWLQARNNVEEWCRQCDTCAARRGPRTRNWGQMHQYNIGASFERIAVDLAGTFQWSDQGNQYLLIAMDCLPSLRHS
jgi:hypothetical protein